MSRLHHNRPTTSPAVLRLWKICSMSLHLPSLPEHLHLVTWTLVPPPPHLSGPQSRPPPAPPSPAWVSRAPVAPRVSACGRGAGASLERRGEAPPPAAPPPLPPGPQPAMSRAGWRSRGTASPCPAPAASPASGPPPLPRSPGHSRGDPMEGRHPTRAPARPSSHPLPTPHGTARPTSPTPGHPHQCPLEGRSLSPVVLEPSRIHHPPASRPLLPLSWEVRGLGPAVCSWRGWGAARRPGARPSPPATDPPP